MIKNNEIFDLLIAYHTRSNLSRMIDHIDSVTGTFKSPVDLADIAANSNFNEGIDENPYTRGILIIANGRSTLDILAQEGFLLHQPRERISIPDRQAFFSYLDEKGNKDGVLIYDTDNCIIMKASCLNNTHPRASDLDSKLKHYLPADFLDTAGRLDLGENIGTKTRLGLTIGLAHPELTVAGIKRTAYGGLSMPKVVQFGGHGLFREFFFKHAPDYDPATTNVPFIDPKKKIIGIQRTYWPQNGSVNLASEQIRTPQQDRINHYRQNERQQTEHQHTNTY